MRRALISLAFGSCLGLLALGVVFGALSVFDPGWLRGLFARSTPTPDLQVAVDGPAATPLPGSTPLSPTPAPTGVPLPTVPGACGGPESMTIALLGVDMRGGDRLGRSRTDAITLVRVNFVHPSAALLSIPRDLYVPLPNLQEVGIDQSRINTAFLYGEIYNVQGGGPAEFSQTIELNFGVRVDRYVMVNFAAFVAGVDALGGIEVDVPKAIDDPTFPLDDDSGTMEFQVPAGPQVFDGVTALRYVRTRHQDDDYQRVQRQQLVLLAIRDRLMRAEVIPQIPGLIAALSNAGGTNLSPAEMAALACIGPKIERADIRALPIDGTMVIPWTTPGGGRVSIPNRDRIAPLVQEFLGVGTAQAAIP